MHSVSRTKKVGSWQAVGAVPAHCRKQARVTQEQFAETASLHVDTVGSIEQGRLALQPDLAVLVAKLPVRERIVQFARGLVDREQEAVGLLSYESLVVPGLLQTRGYCRAVFSYRYPALGSETAEQWVNARMERQLVWQRERPPVGHFVIEESVLWRKVGGPEVMRERSGRSWSTQSRSR
ncbi:helix-turn-helix transcriptional regulator [Streptomyces sp. NPDC005921]|uniref:helix-turn-helix transcriptional regulator n=1 Tax=Streptomyces sp. NPDC005827 TaxID=3157070 RepID=UPI0034062850